MYSVPRIESHLCYHQAYHRRMLYQLNYASSVWNLQFLGNFRFDHLKVPVPKLKIGTPHRDP